MIESSLRIPIYQENSTEWTSSPWSELENIFERKCFSISFPCSWRSCCFRRRSPSDSAITILLQFLLWHLTVRNITIPTQFQLWPLTDSASKIVMQFHRWFLTRLPNIFTSRYGTNYSKTVRRVVFGQYIPYCSLTRNTLAKILQSRNFFLAIVRELFEHFFSTAFHNRIVLVSRSHLVWEQSRFHEFDTCCRLAIRMSNV